MAENQNAFVRLSDWAEETGISRHTLRKMARDGRCPPLVVFSSRMVGWWRADLNAWRDQTRQPVKAAA